MLLFAMLVAGATPGPTAIVLTRRIGLSPADSANTQFTAATIAAVAGAGLGATAIILW